jgi:hypothetical protein
MIKILTYLLLIRFRKILPKDDYFAIGLFLVFYASVVYFLNRLFPKYYYYFPLTVLEILLYHANRKDIELLKLYKNFKSLLFIEYIIYSLPFLLVYVVNYKFEYIAIHAIVIMVLLNFKQPKSRIIKYPLQLFDPFWHISFRKDKLLLLVPLVIFLNIIGATYNNENLNIATLFIVSIIGCLPTLQREELVHIKISFFESKKYLVKQIKTIIYNVSILCIPLIICLLALQKWNLLLFLPLVWTLPVISLLFKYSFFTNKLLHQILLALFLTTIQFGIPILILPYLFHKSIKTINKIQNVRN